MFPMKIISIERLHKIKNPTDYSVGFKGDNQI